MISPMGPRHSLFDALDHMLSANAAAVAVVDAEGCFRGVLDMDAIRALMNTGAPAGARGSDALQEA